MNVPVSHAALNYLAAVIVIATILGGGTQQGLSSDHLLQLFLIPVVYLGISGFRMSTYGVFQTVLLIGIVSVIGLQFWPLVHSFPTALNLEPMTGFYSLTPQRSIEAGLFLLTVVPVYLLVRRVSIRQRVTLVRLIFVAVAINLSVAVLQAASKSVPFADKMLPYELLGGFFANPNHFAALVYSIIPLVGWALLHERKSRVGYILVVLILVGFQVLVGTAAGMGIAAILSIVTFFAMQSTMNKRAVGVWIVLLVLLFAAGITIYARDSAVLDGSDRLEFFANTITAIQEVFPKGTGLGSFIQVYPSFESLDQLAAEYTNHAHNDYLEVVLETGLPGVIVLALYALILLLLRPDGALQKAALMSILAILAHSVVDYPLRTMAVAVLFAVLNGLAFSSSAKKKKR